jgi:alanine-synthesizing transaminase
VEFRRITNLPPYVFTIINNLKIKARHEGNDVVDLGFGNPDIPSPQIAVDKLIEAAQNSKNHRYSLSRGLPKLREAVADMYMRNWGVKLNPETQITNTIGSKEGFSHLMWVLLDRGDAAIVPSPSYPIHIYGPIFAGADVRQVPMRSQQVIDDQQYSDEFFENLTEAYKNGWPRPRVLVVSFPHNPTGATVDLPFMQRVVDFCRERDMIVVHDFAYADVGFDGYKPPSILQAEGAMECAVELYSMTKSFSMAGWRVAFMAGNEQVVGALMKLKSYLDYGTFQPVQIAATVTLNEAQDFPQEVSNIYEGRRNALIDGLDRIGWHIPKSRGSMFVWAPIPEAYKDMDSVEFCSHLVRDCNVALSPGAGFGPGGEGFARFALIENEQRIAQAVRNLKAGLTRLQ